MKNYYLDNASTSYPKPKEVADAIYDYICNSGSNINRGCYESAYSVEEKVLETRELLCQLFHGDDCKNVVFTKNVTESLNILLKGFLKPGDHVLVSSMEHNSVMRPITQLTEQGVTFSRIPCSAQGELQLEQLETLYTAETKAVVMMHASNVCGTILPIKEVGEWCQEHNLRFIVDCAQTAGCLPIDMQEMHIDALAFTGHKGLLGPQGIGGFVLKNDFVAQITPLLSGGSGSISHAEEIPTFMPDRFEAGTPNIPGILGLRAGLLWITNIGLEKIHAHELHLTNCFLEGLKPLFEENLIKLIGLPSLEQRIGVVSLQTLTQDISEIAYELDEKYHIMTRVGLHCAPSAHKTLGTFPTGTLRFSFGIFNTEEDVTYAINALKELCHGN